MKTIVRAVVAVVAVVFFSIAVAAIAHRLARNSFRRSARISPLDNPADSVDKDDDDDASAFHSARVLQSSSRQRSPAATLRLRFGPPPPPPRVDTYSSMSQLVNSVDGPLELLVLNEFNGNNRRILSTTKYFKYVTLFLQPGAGKQDKKEEWE